MNTTFAWVLAATLLFGFSSNGWTQDDDGDDGETTIRLMGAHEAELPDAVTDDIELPGDVDEEAVENAKYGLDTANENRKRREEGLATADEALSNAADLAEDALDNIEDRARAEDIVDDIPGRPGDTDTPDVPDVPDVPTGQ